MATFRNKTDTPEQLFKRFMHAKNRMELQRDRLQNAYDLALPNRANFDESVAGEQRNLQIFDDTAPHGLTKFANDVQSILMPPYQRWATLVPGHEVTEEEEPAARERLEEMTDVFFNYLEQSNFYQVSAESILDMGISTGIMIFEEGTDDNPFVFRSISISEVAFEEGRRGQLQNFWRQFKTTMRQLMLKWPNAKLTSSLKARLSSDPDETVELIEGLVLVPGKTELTDEFEYYVQDMQDKSLIIDERRDWLTWIGFRANKTTDEVIGYGPILRVLPTIRVLNQMQEWDLRSFKFAALGVMLIENSGVLNPFNTVVEPGSLIPIEPSVSGKDPIRPLKSGQDPRITLEKIQARQAVINDALFSNPLPPETKSGVSATEISIRQENWVRQNTAAFGRLTVELIEPTISIGMNILIKKKLIKSIGFKIDKKRVSIKYKSPLIAIQDQQDVRGLQEAIQAIQESQGAEGVLVAYNVAEVNKFINEKLGVPSKLVATVGEMEQKLNTIKQSQQQQQAAAQQAQLAPGQVEQPQLPLAPEGQ